MANYLEEIEQLSLSVEDLIDAEPPIIINTLTRNLEIQNGFNTQIAVEGDLSANEITFECDRYIDGYDVYNADSAYVIWKNSTAGTEDAYLASNRTLKGTDKFQFSWLLSREVSKAAGTIECSVCFIEYADAERTTISYKWASNPFNELTIGVGLPNAEIDEKEVVEEGDFERNPAEEVARPHLSDVDNEVSFNMLNRNFTFDPNMNTQIAVENDCYSSIITFKAIKNECDYNIEEASVVVAKWGINNNVGYEVIQRETETNEYISYSWMFSPKIAKQAGQLTFALCFITIDNEHKVISRWNSNPCSVLSVGKGMYFADIDDAEKIDQLIAESISQEELTKLLEEVFEI